MIFMIQWRIIKKLFHFSWNCSGKSKTNISLSTQRLGNITQWLFDFVCHWQQNLHQRMMNWETRIFLYDLAGEHLVITTVSDEPSSNRKIYWMHEQMRNTDNSAVVLRTINFYSPGRYIWFFPDPPYLTKSARNCIAHSGRSIYLFNKSNKMTTNWLLYRIL